jgi:hypothetical protein
MGRRLSSHRNFQQRQPKTVERDDLRIEFLGQDNSGPAACRDYHPACQRHHHCTTFRDYHCAFRRNYHCTCFRDYYCAFRRNHHCVHRDYRSAF